MLFQTVQQIYTRRIEKSRPQGWNFTRARQVKMPTPPVKCFFRTWALIVDCSTNNNKYTAHTLCILFLKYHTNIANADLKN